MSKADARILLRSAVILLLAMWAMTADSWGRAAISFSIVPIRSELGLKIVEIGYIFGAQSLAFAVGSLVMAVLIALAGVRWVYGLAILGDVLAMVLLGGAQRLSWLVVASACRGFFGGAIFIGGIQVVAEWFPSDANPGWAGVTRGRPNAARSRYIVLPIAVILPQFVEPSCPTHSMRLSIRSAGHVVTNKKCAVTGEVPALPP